MLANFMYKLSQFNLQIASNTNDKYIVYNTLFDSIIVLDKPIDIFLKDATSEEYQKLISMGFIVPSDMNEFAFLRKLQKKQATSNKQNLSHITIAPTLACNAKCFYCYEEGIAPRRMDDEAIEQSLLYIRQNAATNEPIHITWFGGEPFMELETIEKIVHGLQTHLEVFCSAITNGSFLTPKNIETLKKLNFKHFQVSLDGFGSEYEKRKNYSDKTDFESIVHNISNCIDSEIHVSLRLNIDKDNLYNIVELINYLGVLFPDSKFISAYPSFLFGNTVPNPFLNDEEKTEAVSILLETLKKYSLIDNKAKIQNKPILSPCMAHSQGSIVIDPYGNLFKCEHDVGNHNLSIGNVVSNSTLYNPLSIPLSEQYSLCKTCIYYPKCAGGCDATRRDGDSPCGLQKYVIPFYLKKILEQDCTKDDCFVNIP